MILILVLFCLLNKSSANVNKIECQRRIDFDASKDMIENMALTGHSIATTSVNSAPQCQIQCILNSDCLSTNYIPNKKGGLCELKRADELLATKDFGVVPGVYYCRLDRKNHCSKGVVFDPLKHKCPKSACLRKDCPPNTACQEMCFSRFKRYICRCLAESSQNCESLPRTCDDIRKSLGFVPSDGVYFVYDILDKLFQVYCDFSSELGFAYTLMESFSFGNRSIFRTLGFYVDSPIEESSMNWMKYRLSKGRMETITKTSTHIRATCNIHIKFTTRDYFRAKLKGFPLFQQFTKTCLTYEHLSIMGKTCSQCTSGTYQVLKEHFHLNPGVASSCLFGPAQGFSFVQSFGLYNRINASHGCSSSPSSTTQYWVGTKYK